MCTHLTKVPGSISYYFRRKIPQDLVSHYRKAEIKKSLRTSNRRDAERLARIEGIRLDTEFATIRGESTDTSVSNLWTSLAPVKVDNLWDLNLRRGEVNRGQYPKAQIFFSTLVEKWAAEGQRNLKTVDMYSRTASRFQNLIGKIRIHDVKREDVVRFKDELLKSGQSAANTNKQLIVVNTLLNYAKANALIDANSASGVSIKIERKEKPRVAFDADALNAIFSSPIYSDSQRPKAGAGEAAYWLPLLALYTGARIEELGQLHPSDVMEETYYDGEGSAATAWVIRIKHSEEVGQGVKNFGSNRRVPIHSELVRLGFLSYALAAQAEGRYRIFDKLVADKYGTETAQFSKWFGRYLRRTCGILDKRMTFHSFRHTFKDFCRVTGIDVGDKLTGHVTGRVGDAYGADLYPLAPLVDAINRYRTFGLDMSKLKFAT